MERLNATQRKALRVLKGRQLEHGFMEWTIDHEDELLGLAPEELGVVVDELERRGLLQTLPDGDGGDFRICLGSDLMGYFEDRREERLKTLGARLFQLALGASGGLVVWLLTRLVG